MFLALIAKKLAINAISWYQCAQTFDRLYGTNEMVKPLKENEIVENLKLLADWLHGSIPGSISS